MEHAAMGPTSSASSLALFSTCASYLHWATHSSFFWATTVPRWSHCLGKTCNGLHCILALSRKIIAFVMCLLYLIWSHFLALQIVPSLNLELRSKVWRFCMEGGKHLVRDDYLYLRTFEIYCERINHQLFFSTCFPATHKFLLLVIGSVPPLKRYYCYYFYYAYVITDITKLRNHY